MTSLEVMKKGERFCDLLKDIDVSSVDALLILSERTWELGSISYIKKLLSREAFTVHVVSNVIANWKGDGWCSIIEEHPDILLYIPESMNEIGLSEVGEAVRDLTAVFPEFVDFSTCNQDYCDTVNFIRNLRTKVENSQLNSISVEEREILNKDYLAKMEILEELVEEMWGCGATNNAGWGTITSYLNEHINDKVWSE